MSNQSNVFAVVVTYNGAKWIARALDSLRESEVSVSVIVVDNASQDNTCNIVADNYPEINLIRETKNLGFSVANNRGIELALNSGADYILLLNQDAAVSKNMLRLLLNQFSNNNRLGILSPLHFDYDGKSLDYCFFVHSSNNRQLYSDALLYNLKPIYEVPFVAAALWLISKKAIESVGKFDESYFLYGEDQEYCRRMRSLGFGVGVVPAAIGYHYHARLDAELMPLWKQKHIYNGKMLFFLGDPDKGKLRRLKFATSYTIKNALLFLCRGHFRSALVLSLAFCRIVLPSLIGVKKTS